MILPDGTRPPPLRAARPRRQSAGGIRMGGSQAAQFVLFLGTNLILYTAWIIVSS